MFGKFTYFYYTLSFTLPLIFVLWIYFYSILVKNIRLISLTTIILTIYGFFIWPLALVWKAWAYDFSKTLSIKLLGTVLEDVVWWLLVSFLISSVTVVMLKKEKNKEKLFKRN